MDQITIGLPVYNGMPFVRETVESLLAQTSSRFRVLVTVDESTDGTEAYLRSVKDARFQIIFQRRSGLIPTLNRMLREVETPWLMRLDADDIAYPQRVQRTLEYIAKYPETAIFPATAEYYPRGRALGVFRSSWGTPEELRKQVRSGYLLSFCHPAVTLNVEKILSLGGYDETLQHAEDADLWWRAALVYDIRIIPEALVGYRQHSGQSTTTALKQNAVDLLYVQYRLLSQLWGLTPLPKETVRPHLEGHIPLRHLVAKTHLRDVNIQLAQADRISAARSALAAIAASPSFVWRRFRDDRRRNQPILNGVDPKRFSADHTQLWPGQRFPREVF